MTKSKIVAQLESVISDRKSFLDEDGQGDDIILADITALTEAIEIISTAHTGKLYTAFDVIRLVQAAVSDAVCGCGMGAEESTVTAYEIERDIVSKLVGEEQKHDD